MAEIIEFELSKEYLERFTEAVKDRQDEFILSTLEGINFADITELLMEFDGADSKYVLDLLEPQLGADVIVELEEDIQAKFLELYTSEEIAKYLDLMDSDDSVDILNGLPVSDREEIISLLVNEEKAGHILDLLRYPEGVAGSLMAKELIKANLNWSIQRCIEEIRKQAEKVQKIYSVYVVDNQDKLLGKVSLKKIILAEDNTKVEDIYDDDVISVETHELEEDAVQTMQKYDLDALPIVNVRGLLVGRITIDDAVDVITEQAEEDIQMMSGITSDVEEDDKFIGLFEADIASIPLIAFFIPLITATGGNVGIQSSTIVVQSLAHSNAFEDSTIQKLMKMLLVAAVNGVVLSLIVFGTVMLTTSDQKIASTVSIALFSVVLLASFMGTITPLILDRFGINPAVASGPFITTANDLVGLGVYFSVAHFLYSL